jgi:hypothetical protein
MLRGGTSLGVTDAGELRGRVPLSGATLLGSLIESRAFEKALHKMHHIDTIAYALYEDLDE